MKRVSMCCLALCWTCTALAQELKVMPNPIPAPAEAGVRYVPNQLIVVVNPAIRGDVERGIAVQAQSGPRLPFAIGRLGFDDVTRRYDVQQVEVQFPGTRPVPGYTPTPDMDMPNYFIVTFNPQRGRLDEVVESFARADGVIRVERIGIHPVDLVPNDTNYGSQYHLNQATDRDIDAPEGWNLETGDPSRVVAVLDTGMRYYHRDLGGSATNVNNVMAADGNVWINTAEKNGVPGVDDDTNGRIDDWVGYDFVNTTGCWPGEDCATVDNDPRDFNGHGTHCCGNVAALNNNAYATCSAAGGFGNGTFQPTGNGCKVMGLRIGFSADDGFGNEAGFVNMGYAASAIDYARVKGCRIISCSWGSSNTGGIATALNNFVAAGGLVFKAAGNNNNETADYMCNRADVYCIAATTATDAKASFSSYGTWVDISAAGNNITSLYHNHADPNNDYVATISGTSMSTPIVASVAGNVWSRYPTWTSAQVWTRIQTTADNINSQIPLYLGKMGSGRVNLFSALKCQNNGDCSDGNVCNGTEVCNLGTGACSAGTLSADCNTNNTEDSCDITMFGAADVNSNGTPDACEGTICLTCRGDMNGDNSVDGQDTHCWTRCYIMGLVGGVSATCTACGCADMDNNGILNGTDQTMFLNKLTTDVSTPCP